VIAMRRTVFFALPSVAALVFLLLTSAGAATPPGDAISQQAAPPHPQVEAGQDCETCHREKTPAVVEGWEKGPHGMNSVKCFVCHGSAGDKAFTTRPAMSKCEACHSEQVATMTAPAMKDKTCFTCHDPHALNPHKAAVQGGKK
jgi:hypothetical protein